MYAHIVLFVFSARAIVSTIGAPAPNPVDLPNLDFSQLPGLPKIPAIPEIPGFPNLNGLVPTLKSSGCDVSKTPAVGDFNSSQILGNWYHLYHSKNELTDRLTTDLYTVTDVRHTIAEDFFYATTLHMFMCTTNSYLGGLYSHDICPAAHYKISILAGGILKLELPSMAKAVLSSLIPTLSFDHIEQRVIAMEKDFAMFYSCILPLKDGTCANNGLYLNIFGRSKQVSSNLMEKLNHTVSTTCLKFDELKPVAQEGDFPFYIPTSTDLSN